MSSSGFNLIFTVADQIHQKAIDVWKTPLFAPYFHQTGFLHCVSGNSPQKAVETLKRFQTAAEKHSRIQRYVVPIRGSSDIQQLSSSWQFDGPLSGWNGYVNWFDGYAHSANALAGIAREVQAAQGVRLYIRQGVKEIVYEELWGKRTSRGIRTNSGVFHSATLVIVAAGAAASKLVPEVAEQVVAKCWSVAHVKLTDEETSALRGIPVTYARDFGFLFEPDPKTNLLKICPMGGGYINTDPKTRVSLPPSLAESAILPSEDERRIRQLLRQTLPALANRPLVKKSLCWFADTADSDFIIDFVPQTSSSVILLSGDSGHGFKMFPIFGEWVRNLLESPDNKQEIARWRWKHPKSQGQNANWGSDVSWRLGETREFRDIEAPLSSKI
jgi:sarcosine oxidase / L-pipecolate oxidase